MANELHLELSNVPEIDDEDDASVTKIDIDEDINNASDRKSQEKNYSSIITIKDVGNEIRTDHPSNNVGDEMGTTQIDFINVSYNVNDSDSKNGFKDKDGNDANSKENLNTKNNEHTNIEIRYKENGDIFSSHKSIEKQALITPATYHDDGTQTDTAREAYGAFDNPAYRRFESTPYTQTPNGLFTITGNHLIHPKDRPEENKDHYIRHSFPHHKPYGSHRTNNTGTFKNMRGYIGGSSRSNRYSSHNKYATTRHPPVIAYSPRRARLVPNGDIRQSQSLGRSSAQFIRSPSPYLYGTLRHPVTVENEIGHGNIDKRPFVGVNDYLPQYFVRQGLNRKDQCISFFDIEMDKVSSYQYRPGEEISGAINIIVHQNLEIRFVELIALGQGHITLRRSREGLSRTVKETFLYKHTYVIGSSDHNWSSILTPGHYTSKFRVKLPSGLPSSFSHNDATNGLNFDVTYTLKARICEGVGQSSSRSSSGRQAFIKVLMSKQIHFNIQRAFDLNTQPDATMPVTHSEQIFLSCTHQEAAIVSVTLERSIFLAGDDIRLQLTASLPTSQRVKDIKCILQEHVILDSKHEPITFKLSQMIRKDPYHQNYFKKRRRERPAHQGAQEKDIFDVTIPTPVDLVSPFSLGASHMRVEYSLQVVLKFSPAGGKLSFKVPLKIGPCAEPIYAEKISSRKAVPLFNRPTRFPFFTSPSTPTSDSSPRPLSSESRSSSHVTSKYTNSFFGRCFLCCFSGSGRDE